MSIGVSGSNALRQNIESKGTNAYYYAHNREFEIPEDAIVRGGPGIITGGAPTLIKSAENSDGSSPRYRAITNYMFLDETDRVQIIIEMKGDMKGEKLVSAELEPQKTSFDLIVKCEGSRIDYRLHVPKLYETVVPDKCKHRVNAEKGKITVTLHKEKKTIWTQLKAAGK